MNNGFSQKVQWARVDYNAQIAQAAFTTLMVAPEVKGPGLSAGDAVQVVTYLSVLRDVVASYDTRRGGPYAKIALYDGDGKPYRLVDFVGKVGALDAEMGKKGLYGAMVVGEAPFLNPHVDVISWTPIPGWGRKLALALEGTIIGISNAEQGPDIPAGFAEIIPAILPAVLAPVAIIVTGAAIAVIGSVAAWRYLDPDFRRDSTLIRVAAEDYAKRLSIFQDTGNMPPPSENEQKAVDTVEKMASARSNSDWIWAVALAGGLALGSVATVAIARHT
jgi:hypothetical protein